MIKTLLVDDEAFILDTLKYTIPWKKYDMEISACATSGQMALELFSKEKFDLVITDIKMPHMTGIELIQKLHSISEHVNFIVISSYDDFSLVRKSFKYGAIDYILKIDLDNSNVIDSILENTRMKLSQKFSFNISNFYEKVLGDVSIIPCTDLSEYPDLVKLKTKLLDRINTLDFEAVLNLYLNFLNGLKTYYVTPPLFFQEAYNVLSFLHNTLISYGFGLSILPALPNYSLNILNEFNTFNKLSHYLLSIVKTTINNVKNANIYDVPTLLSHYISTNYAIPDLSLEFISQQLGIDKKNLSKICKQATGLNFKAYLNYIRIENAKHLLINSSLKINEISYKVGYSNIEHFCRVFSKLVGISPSTFQTKYLSLTNEKSEA